MSRYVTVASVSGLRPTPEEVLEEAAHYVWRAARMGADIVAFPECFAHYGVPTEKWARAAEEVPGATVTHMGK
jgi:predicted amidohydrolase